MSRGDRLVQQLRPEYLLTIPVVVGSFTWAALVHFSDIQSNGTSRVLERFGALAITHVALFAVPFIVWLMVRRDRNQRRVLVLLAVAVGIGCVLRGVIFAELIDAGPNVQQMVAFRSLTSFTHMALAILLLWLWVSAVHQHADRRRELLAEQQRLLDLQAEAAVQLQKLDEQAAEQVRTSVLEGLGHGLPAQGDEVLRRMRLTLDDVVRPLSRQLESQGEVWVEPARADADYRVRWWPTMRGALDPVRIHPVLVTAMMVWTTIVPIYVRYGAAFGTATLLSLVVILLPALWLTRMAAVRLTRSGPWGVRALAFVVALVGSSVLFGRFDVLYLPLAGRGTPFALAATVYPILYGVIVAVADSALQQRHEVEAELEEASADLRWAIARAREKHRQHRLALTHAVHGRIQATLAAAIMQLDTALRQGEASEQLVQEVQDRVLDCVDGLDLRSTEPDPLPDLLHKVRVTWSGATTIELSSPQGVEAVLNGDPQCLTTLNDVVPELVFNSVRHGGADRVDILLAQPEGNLLELAVIDNGAGSAPPDGLGLGTRLLDDCSLTWSRELSGDGSVTRLLLPVLPTKG